MPVVHFQYDEQATRGVLLETFTGEVVPGDQLELSPCPVVAQLFAHRANLSPYRLRLICQDEITDPLAGDFSGHKATFLMHGGRPVIPADQLEKWSALIDTVLRYKSAVSPCLHLDFTVLIHYDTSTRHVGAYRDYSGGPKPARPDMVGARVTVSWWVSAVESDLSLQSIAGG